MTVTMTKTEVEWKALQYGIPPQTICTTCGRVAYQAEHFDHTVTRLHLPEGLRLPAPGPVRTSAASPARRATAPRGPVIEWLTVLNVAEELGVSKMTVYRLVHSGELASHRIGRSFRIKRTALLDYIENTEVEV